MQQKDTEKTTSYTDYIPLYKIKTTPPTPQKKNAQIIDLSATKNPVFTC